MSLAAKAESFDKVSKQWVEQMSSVFENQFKVMGAKTSEWQGKAGESFMDKSVQINADTILENVKLVVK